jgi:hypothetical protein
MGATENLLTTDLLLEARFSGFFADICCTLIYYGLPRFLLILLVSCCNVATKNSRVEKSMGTITTRKRKDGSAAYTAQIRITQKGATVYQESQTFDRKATAQAWIKKRESELAAPGAIEKANRRSVSVKEMIELYLDEYEKLRPLGKTKRATLKAIGETWLGKVEDKDITSQILVEYAIHRMEKDGIQAQTVGSDLAHLGAVLSAARPGLEVRH